MKNLGLEPEFIEEFSDDIPTGSIIRQEPESGAFVKKGDAVTFYVSKGPENTEKEEKPDNNPQNNDTPQTNNQDNKPDAPKKSTMLTIYGPKNKDSALVQVNVNGKTEYSKTLKKGESAVVKLEGTSSSVEVEILHDGVSQQKSNVRLH